jgi:hypothetical protein
MTTVLQFYSVEDMEFCERFISSTYKVEESIKNESIYQIKVNLSDEQLEIVSRAMKLRGVRFQSRV